MPAEYKIEVNGQVEIVDQEERKQVDFDSGAVLFYIGARGELRVADASKAFDECRLNGRTIPRWLASARLMPGDELLLGETKPVRVKVSSEKEEKGDTDLDLVVRLGRNDTFLKVDQMALAGLSESDTRAMLKWNGKHLRVAAVRERDLVFMWNGKANYLFPYHWYRVSPDDEIRVGGVDGTRFVFPPFEHGDDADVNKAQDFGVPHLTIDSARLHSIVTSKLELYAQESSDSESEFTQHVLCLGDDRLSDGWRLRRAGSIGARTVIYARRLRDDHPAMVEFDVPDHRFNPREYYERADFALSNLSHPHIMRLIRYGNVPHPSYKHGAYHVRVLERFSGLRMSSIMEECGRLDAKTTMSIMIPVLASLEAATRYDGNFAPSQELIVSRRTYGPEPRVSGLGESGAFIAGAFFMDQIWLCILPDGRLVAQVDCHMEPSYDDGPDKFLQRPAKPIIEAGRVLYILLRGKKPPDDEEEMRPSTTLSGLEARLSEIAMGCIRQDDEAPGSISDLLKLLEEVWRQMLVAR